MLPNLLAVGCGGFIGACLRYLCTLLTRAIARAAIDAPSFGFPVGILAINLVGCFFMGWLALWLPVRFPGNQHVMLFATVGLLGGFTTLSTFGLDTWRLFMDGSYGLAALNTLLTLAVCFVGIVGGVALARAMSAA